MAELNKDAAVNGYKNTLIDKEKKILDLIELGYITNPCAVQTFGILTHCVENIEIFNNRQTINVVNFINKLSYV